MILAVAEHRDGVLNRASWETLAAAQQCGLPVKSVILGSGSASKAAAEIAAADLVEVVIGAADALEPYTADGHVEALQQIFQAERPALVFLPHTYQTRDFVPRLAARLNCALITDCTAVKNQDGGRTFVRPMFQGKLSADVEPLGPPPHVVTFQIGAFRADAVKRGSAASAIRSVALSVARDAIRQTPEPPFREAKQAVDLSQAERIVAAGRGIKEQQHMALVERLAQALGAEVAASRPICDAGWLPMERQIGSSGQTVAPKLYVALGISGAIQHLVGMKGSRTIVAINKDAEAPIFEIADYGIVGDLFEVVPAMIAELQK
jgi:electron transfer flavoprotein alpha subunit